MCEKKEKTDCTMTDTAFAEHIVARIFSILKECVVKIAFAMSMDIGKSKLTTTAKVEEPAKLKNLKKLNQLQFSKQNLIVQNYYLMINTNIKKQLENFQHLTAEYIQLIIQRKF